MATRGGHKRRPSSASGVPVSSFALRARIFERCVSSWQVPPLQEVVARPVGEDGVPVFSPAARLKGIEAVLAQPVHTLEYAAAYCDAALASDELGTSPPTPFRPVSAAARARRALAGAQAREPDPEMPRFTTNRLLRVGELTPRSREPALVRILMPERAAALRLEARPDEGVYETALRLFPHTSAETAPRDRDGRPPGTLIVAARESPFPWSITVASQPPEDANPLARTETRPDVTVTLPPFYTRVSAGRLAFLQQLAAERATA